MARVVASTWFLLWTAGCFAVAIGFATWVGEGSSAGVRVLCLVVGVLVAAVVMLLIAWAAATPTPVEAGPPAPAPEPEPEPEPERAAPLLRYRLEEQLLAGERLRGSGATGVAAWIRATQELLGDASPGLAGYFRALSNRAFADDAERLDAHLARLRTIIRDVPG